MKSLLTFCFVSRKLWSGSVAAWAAPSHLREARSRSTVARSKTRLQAHFTGDAVSTHQPVQKRLGIIGVGTITSAVVTGLCAKSDRTADDLKSSHVAPSYDILLSPGSSSKAFHLAKRFCPPTLEAALQGSDDSRLLGAEAGPKSSSIPPPPSPPPSSSPSVVTGVAADNQAVVDGSDVVVLGVLPSQALSCVGALSFDVSRHTLLSLVAGVPREDLAKAARLPLERVVCAVPLPAVAKRRGVTVVFGGGADNDHADNADDGDADDDGDSFGSYGSSSSNSVAKGGQGGSRSGSKAVEEALALFGGSLGVAVACGSEREMAALQTLTAMMGPFYGGLSTCQKWLTSKGVAPDLAAYFTGSLMASIAQDGADSSALKKVDGDDGADAGKSLESGGGGANGFEALIAEQTPGGYNEQALRAMLSKGSDPGSRSVFGQLEDTLEAVHARWTNKNKNENEDGNENEDRAATSTAAAEGLAGSRRPRSRSTATVGEEECVWGVGSYEQRKERLHRELQLVGVDFRRLEGTAPPPSSPTLSRVELTTALRLYRSLLLPKSAGALAVASTAGRAKTVAAQIAFAVREADASAADWLKNVDSAREEKQKRSQSSDHSSSSSSSSGNEDADAKDDDLWWWRLPSSEEEEQSTADASSTTTSSSTSSTDKRPPQALVFVLDGLRSAENVGNLIRTAEACGACGVVTCGTCPRPPDKAVLKSAVHSASFVPCVHSPTAREAVQRLQACQGQGGGGFSVWGLETTSRSELYTDPPSTSAAYPPRVALVLGNELSGVDPSALEACDRLVAIPTFGFKNSLNVAVAGSVVAYEVVRAWGQGKRGTG